MQMSESEEYYAEATEEDHEKGKTHHNDHDGKCVSMNGLQ